MSASNPPHPKPRHAPYVLALLLLLLAGVAALRLCVGQSFGWPPGGLGAALWRLFIAGWSSGSAQESVLDIRLLRLVAACLVGMALATSGVALQSLLRNPLAEPFILGLSSGAAVGVMGQWFISYSIGRYLSASHLGALLGAAASAGIVYAASRRRGVLDPVGLLLTGVVLSTINGAVVMVLNYVLGPAGLKEDIGRWMMGYLNETISSPTILLVTLVTLLGLALLVGMARAMDVASFSDTEAQSLGVNLPRLRTLLFLVSATLAAGAVVLAGPIGFVGLICPHLVRLLLGPGHRNLLLGSALLGAILVTLADTAAVGLDRALGIGIMPIGIFTAILGGPMFLWMLHPRLGRGEE